MKRTKTGSSDGCGLAEIRRLHEGLKSPCGRLPAEVSCVGCWPGSGTRPALADASQGGLDECVRQEAAA
jgi:hypothetical protein